MPELSPMVINTLTRLTNAFDNRLTGPDEYNNPACYHWALTGLTEPCVRADTVFAHMTGYPNDRISRTERNWLGNAANTAPLTASMRTFTQAAAGDPKDAARTNASIEAARRVIEANGLTTSAGATHYRLFMMYTTRYTNERERRDVVPPNQQHWWLDVGGCTIEVFPTIRHVRIYKGNNYVTPSPSHAYWSTYLTGLHQAQVDMITKVVDLRKAWWVGVPAVPAARQTWIDDTARPRCSWCYKPFSCLTRRHHCRRCGEIFCDHCTRFREEVDNPATRPGTRAESESAGEVRVCVRCRD